VRSAQDEPPEPPADIVEAFLAGNGKGPQEHDFSVLWEGTGSKEWNQQASMVFEDSFLRCCAEGLWLGQGVTAENVQDIDISSIFLQRLRDMKKLYHGKRRTSNQVQQLKKKQRKISRRHGVRFLNTP
jgi:hypothetical protein